MYYVSIRSIPILVVILVDVVSYVHMSGTYVCEVKSFLFRFCFALIYCKCG